VNRVVLKDDLIAINTKLTDLQSQINAITAAEVGGGSGLEYKEVVITTTLAANETKSIDELLSNNTLIITNLYFDTSGGNIKFKLVNKAVDGFVVYEIDSVSDYMDSLFLTYNDNDNEKKLRTIITNESSFETTVTITILGMVLT